MQTRLNHHYSHCPVCSSRFAWWATKRSEKAVYHIDRCTRCGYAFVNPRPNMGFLMNYYAAFGLGNAYGQKEMPTLDSVQRQEQQDPNSTVDARRLLNTLLRLAGTPKGRKFLDVGCGSGFFSKEALSNGYEVVALELAKTDRAIAAQLTGLTPLDASFEDFKHPPQSFSVVLMSQILEHALDINLWIEKANGLLEKGGILAIALPNFGGLSRIVLREREPYICPPAHLNFFSPLSLTALLTRHGFQVAETQWVSRIPAASLQRRLPKPFRHAWPIVRWISSASLRVVDGLRLGIMINVYARKTSATSEQLNADAPLLVANSASRDAARKAPEMNSGQPV